MAPAKDIIIVRPLIRLIIVQTEKIIMNDPILKYPRTHHIEGSGIQKGDESLDVVSFDSLVGRHLVIEEKMDGANCAVSFSEDGRLLLQSRGHYLTGGEREKQFHLF